MNSSATTKESHTQPRNRTLLPVLVVIVSIALISLVATLYVMWDKNSMPQTIRVWYTELLPTGNGVLEQQITEEMLFSQGKQSELILLPQGYEALRKALGENNFKSLLSHPVEDRYGDFVVDWGTAEEGRYLTISGKEDAGRIFDAICPYLEFTETPGNVCQFASQRVASGKIAPRQGAPSSPYIAKIRLMNLKTE